MILNWSISLEARLNIQSHQVNEGRFFFFLSKKDILRKKVKGTLYYTYSYYRITSIPLRQSPQTQNQCRNWSPKHPQARKKPLLSAPSLAATTPTRPSVNLWWTPLNAAFSTSPISRSTTMSLASLAMVLPAAPSSPTSSPWVWQRRCVTYMASSKPQNANLVGQGESRWSQRPRVALVPSLSHCYTL